MALAKIGTVLNESQPFAYGPCIDIPKLINIRSRLLRISICHRGIYTTFAFMRKLQKLSQIYVNVKEHRESSIYNFYFSHFVVILSTSFGQPPPQWLLVPENVRL